MFWDTSIGVLSFVPNVSIFTKYEFPRGSISNSDFMCPASGDPDIIADDVCDGVARDIGFAETAVQSTPRWSGTFQGALRSGAHDFRLTACYTDGINQLVGDLTTQQAANFNHQEGLWLLDFNYSWQINAASGINAPLVLPAQSRMNSREPQVASYASVSGRCARRNERMWRTATGIRSGGCFHGKRLTWAFGARSADSMAAAYGCGGVSSGSTSIGVSQARTKSRVTVKTKSALERNIVLRKASTIGIVISGRRATRSGPHPLMLAS